MFLIKIYIKESYINYYHTIIQMCGQYCILAPRERQFQQKMIRGRMAIYRTFSKLLLAICRCRSYKERPPGEARVVLTLDTCLRKLWPFYENLVLC